MYVINTNNMKVSIEHYHYSRGQGHSRRKLLLPGKVQVDIWTIPEHLKVYPVGRGHALSNRLIFYSSLSSLPVEVVQLPHGGYVQLGEVLPCQVMGAAPTTLV